MKKPFIKTINNIFIKKNSHLLLCISIFFFRLPPLILIPSLSSIIQTHNIARIIIIILFFSILILKRKSPTQKNNITFMLVGIYFVTQSLSIIESTNVTSFISVWKDTLLSLILYYVATKIITERSLFMVTITFIISTTINVVFQLFIYFFPAVTLNLIQPVLYEKYWINLKYQLDRNRYFGDSFDEIVIPLILTKYSTSKRSVGKISYMALICCIIFITYISNWRTKTIMLLSAIISSFIFMLKSKYVFIFSILIMLIVLLANYASLAVVGGNVYDRFSLNSEVENKTIISRVNYWKEAFDMGMCFPISGVGLGNYFDNLSNKSKLSNFQSSIEKIIIIDDPHNMFFSVFATTGFGGLISLLLLFGYLIIKDMFNFKYLIYSNRLYIIMFWCLFIFALLNPFQYASFLYLFWFLRGIIDKDELYEKS